MRLFLKIFEDDQGNLSSMRIGFIIFIVVFLGNWTYANIMYNQFHPLNFGDMGALASVFIAKAVSKKEEGKSCE